MAPKNPIENLGESLGEYLREQRTHAKLSLRQLADRAGVSNPYLSQIERGLKRPSAEILQELAKGLQISAETLYVKAGFLDERTVTEHRPWDVETAITADPALTDRQKDTLVDIYRSFTGEQTHAMQRQAEEEPAADQNAAPVKVARQTRTRAQATKKAKVSQATKQAGSSAKKTAANKKATSTKKAAARKTTPIKTTKRARS